jgi:hypothetical protein
MTTKSARQNENAYHMLTIAYGGGLAWINDLIKHHEDAVRTLQARKQLYELAVSKDSGAARVWVGSATPIQVLSWTVNDVNNIARNLRLDQAVNHASAIAIATAAAHGVKSN